jgi:hypothetical protein
MVKVVVTAVAVFLMAGGAQAADFAAERAACGTLVRSPLLSLPVGDMQQQVSMRLDRSAEVAKATPTIYGTSPRFVWASEAKVACGMAVGFFGGGEVNEDMVNKCDCFYGRMMAYTNALR